MVVNGIHDFIQYYAAAQMNFCSNKTRFVSTADLVTVRFDDRVAEYEKQSTIQKGTSMEKVYAPFRVDYLKVWLFGGGTPSDGDWVTFKKRKKYPFL